MVDILIVHADLATKRSIYATLSTPIIYISEADNTSLAIRMLENTLHTLFVIVDFRLGEWWKCDEFFKQLAQMPILVQRHSILLLVSTNETIPIRLGSILYRLPVSLGAKPINADALRHAYNRSMRHMRGIISAQPTHKRYS
jgi:hypothetical protein